MGKGRPKKITADVLRKLEDAFKIGCTDKEACLAADIGESTLYDYCKANEDFSERKELLKQSPVFKARKSVVDALEKDPDLALKYLERKVKKEFSTRTENTGEDGGPQVIQIVRYGDTDTDT
ncbi:hypothetical protein [Kiloniella antarctica]|uniref:Transposase n=1 Tax=Kiloniella antarctica TaxID=1550907 RepID=A0ABW5BQK4_9PROT